MPEWIVDLFARYGYAVVFAGVLLANSWETLERWIGRTGLVALVFVIIVALIARWRALTNSPTHQLTK